MKMTVSSNNDPSHVSNPAVIHLPNDSSVSTEKAKQWCQFQLAASR
jgi:hypothetical protein